MYRGAKPTQPRGAGSTVVGFAPRFGIEILCAIFCCIYGKELLTKNGTAEMESRRNGKCHPRGHGRMGLRVGYSAASGAFSVPQTTLIDRVKISRKKALSPQEATK
ncbi:hypothetical protein J437_LFUL012149 [Ladona fulva]|uniref:Uncharacterized protein n=1 Tax=Ladona fulva TaxID=123851 RepID=A0A8K0KDF2_LADFU|nr:hypothetical protein J437_LFUL012149 [Ladona fulva]